VLRLVIAAATPALRSGLRALVQTPDIEVLHEASTADAALRVSADADVLVIAGLSLLQQIADRASDAGRSDELTHLAVVAVADERRVSAVLESLPVRGWAIVPNDGSRDELVAAVVAANAGFGAMPAAWTSRPADAVVAWAADEGPDEPLTAREQDVLELLSVGLSNKRIAERLGISEHTVKFHINAIYGKLGASTRTEAVNRALRRGLLRI
jgi:DNA-binding NarL/FixJ family response regulator